MMLDVFLKVSAFKFVRALLDRSSNFKFSMFSILPICNYNSD